MIVKVLLKVKGEHSIMLFGNSYKTWQEQFEEYYKRLQRLTDGNVEVIKAWSSKADWKGWGGLKWCEETEFQEELNREGCQHGEPDNVSPRKYSEMVFTDFNIFRYV